MRVTVRIGDVEVTVDRPNFDDYSSKATADGPSWRKSLFEGTVLPTLKEETDKAKELYNIKSLSNGPAKNDNV